MTSPASPGPPTTAVEDKPYLGKAVVDGFLRYTSVSAMKMFDPESEGGCNRRFWYVRVGGFKEPTTKALERGTYAAEVLANYLTAGAKNLPDYLLAGVKFLPEPGPDLVVERWMGGKAGGKWNVEKALALRDSLAKPENAPGKAAIEREILRLAGLTACGVPVVGAADYRQRRGVYVDTTGAVVPEPYPTTTAETGDHKTSKDPATYGKSAEALETDIQMVGYGVESSNADPSLTHARLSHNYYSTSRVFASKVTTLVPVERLHRTWETRVEPLVRSIQDVVREKDPSKVEANLGACRAFNRDCPHRQRCPLTTEQLIVDLAKGGDPMSSLFAKYAPAPAAAAAPSIPTIPTQVVPSAPPALPTSNTREAEVAAARAKFLAEDAAASGAPAIPVAAPAIPSIPAIPHVAAPAIQAIPSIPAIPQAAAAPSIPAQPKHTAPKNERVPVTACDVGAEYLVDCEDGSPPRRMKHEGTSRTQGGTSYYFFSDASGGRVKLEAADYVFDVPREPAAFDPGAVLPPDAAKHNALNAADPLPAETIAKIADPEIKAHATEHAARHADHKLAERAMSQAAGEGKTGGRCPGGKQKVTLTVDQIAEQKYVCSTCGKVYEKSKFKAVKDGAAWTFEVPGHNLPSPDEAAPAAPAQAATDPRQTVIPGTQAPAIPAIPTVTTAGAPTVVPSIPQAAPAIPSIPTQSPAIQAAPAIPATSITEQFDVRKPVAYTDVRAYRDTLSGREQEVFDQGFEHGQKMLAKALSDFCTDYCR